MDNLNKLLHRYRGQISNGSDMHWSARELREQTNTWSAHLAQHHLPGYAVGVLMDNGPHWLALDFACAKQGIALVPLPDFFGLDQLLHLVNEGAISTLVTDRPTLAQQLGFHAHAQDLLAPMPTLRRTPSCPALPAQLRKITFTSGTTGAPKGVCLSEATLLAVAEGLCAATQTLRIHTHLCLLPLPVLLENIAGVYAPMLANANIICPPQAKVGLEGSSKFDPQQCLNAIGEYMPHSIIMLPQTLAALLSVAQVKDPRLASLKLVAVGGGKVPKPLLELAAAHGLPVYEGYGLSECGSVVCLNTPEARKQGTVGQALQGVELKLADDGELMIRGRRLDGYLHEIRQADTHPFKDADWLATGDLARIDDEGFVEITGRKKNLIITAFGRNISPEWPEQILLETGAFLQAVVYGDAQAHLAAVLVARPGMGQTHIETAIRIANLQLPDYGQIRAWVTAPQAFGPHNQLTTANGRLRREAIYARYGKQLFGEPA
ncbi:MAG TPA: AMP-binding protein [Limnobacter sp.]|nr:AMP-binding protein [Limnobacter sp.]